MPGRKYSAGTGYRYGFNGKENEVKGESNQQDYGMRIYDPRIGKFLSVDPLTSDYPWYTPYQFAGNDVARNIDLDGGEPSPATTGLEDEGQAATTSETTIATLHNIPRTTFQHWTYHEGGVDGSNAGWMTEEDYYSDVLKPLAKKYDEDNNSAWQFATSRKL